MPPEWTRGTWALAVDYLGSYLPTKYTLLGMISK